MSADVKEKKYNNSDIRLKVNSLTLYRELKGDPAVIGLTELLTTGQEDAARAALNYSAVLSAVIEGGGDNLTEYFLDKVMRSDNAFARAAAAGDYRNLSKTALAAAESDLKTIEILSKADGKALADKFGLAVPAWKTGGKTKFDTGTVAGLYKAKGYGALYGAAAFAYDSREKRLIPIKYPDPVTLENLKEYAAEKQAVVSNTESFLKGFPAQNVLLYGDRGTGKSSTVHAVLNKYSAGGLRLVELSRRDIGGLDCLLDLLGGYPHKFIVFIDDLSFTGEDENFTVLKAVLEGSVRKSLNALIYATSNRRHLVRESFSDRSGDDVHAADTGAHLLSLADRFGLTVTFINPGKAEYLKIVRQIADERKIKMPDAELFSYAERFALLKGGRAPRIAKQLLDIIESAVKQGNISELDIY